VVYPNSNRDLFGRVEHSGAIVSEYYLGEAPLAWRFPARNRIIAGLSDVFVGVEAAEKSGASITARHASDAGRDLWAVPGPIGFPECRGSNVLLSDGAGVLWGIDRFVEVVVPKSVTNNLTVAQNLGAGPVSAGLPEKEAAAQAGVGFEPTRVDVVAQRIVGSAFAIRELLSALALLELKGYVTWDASGAFLRKPADNRGGRSVR
jgi:DNA processing protein